jgi:hypothetical protein
MFKAAELSGLRAEVCSCADQQHNDCPEHQNDESGAGVKETKLDRPRTRRQIGSDGNLDRSWHFNSPSELTAAQRTGRFKTMTAHPRQTNIL